VDDAQLIARSVTDGRSFELLFDRHYRRIHRFCSARAGLDVADDLASETFVIAFRRRADYDASYPDATPWLFGIAVNVVRAFRRRELLRRRTADRGLFASGSTADDAEAFGRSDALRAALRGLSERDRDLIVLFAWAGLTYEQLGESLGMPVGTVRSRISRVREHLRRELEPELVEDAL
jgi:RNA polymerase sigma-70 factor (ECF subfamily)